MSKLRFRIGMSLDGYTAGPNQSLTDPQGVGGMKLHEWVLELAAFRKAHGMEGGVDNESTAVLEEFQAKIGATIMGRNMFGGGPGPWDVAKPWKGWWGNNPPFHHPVFVMTHHKRGALRMEGGTTFNFITDGPEAALRSAKQVAGDLDVSLGGGAKTAQQFLKLGLVDVMEINLAPILLGSGERLFEGVGPDLHGLKLVRTIARPNVTHLKYAKT